MNKFIIILLPLMVFCSKIREKERENVKNMEGQNISRIVKENVSPFIYTELFKRLPKLIDDYAFIHLEDSGDPSGNETLVSIDDPSKMRMLLRTCGLGKNTDQDLVMLKMDNGEWYLVERELFDSDGEDPQPEKDNGGEPFMFMT